MGRLVSRVREACALRSLRSLRRCARLRVSRASQTLKVDHHALRGQSTVEYAVVLAAFLALVIALGALWHLFEDGTVTLHALQSASHHLKDAATGAWGDVFLY